MSSLHLSLTFFILYFLYLPFLLQFLFGWLLRVKTF
nr:MAG TPA: hypothetical protein [Inoviridae sp.]